MAKGLDLDINFSEFHPRDPGRLVLDAVAHDAAELRVERTAPFVPMSANIDPPPYPGHLIERDSDDTETVKLIQQRLCDLSYTETNGNCSKPLGVDGELGGG
jgi:hypothetical protein